MNFGKGETKMSATTSKAYRGLGMDGVIASWYAKNTARNMEDYRKGARRLAAVLPPSACVLEVAPGPGYLAIELAKLGRYSITGLDISAKFVDIARVKARESGVAIDFRQGDAAQMPLEDESFHFVVCRAAFKNFAKPAGALDEMCRVLKPGGRALIDDLRKDASWAAIDRHVAEMRLSWLNSLITRWTFKHILIKRAYTREQLLNFARNSPFSGIEIREESIGMELWLEK
jgi:ubiquinone/menaquinone biosynthesis C-methylase UbiE